MEENKTMLDIFKSKIPDGMELVKIKELSNRHKFDVEYLSTVSHTELFKSCTPGYENSYCERTLNSVLADIYFKLGYIEKAKEYLNKAM